MPQPENKTSNSITFSLFQGGGEMGALMRAYDWDNHPLGNPETWPQSLQTNIRLLLHSDFPMFIWWSEDFYMFHNDAYLPALGNKHPKALGASARIMWAEIWDQLGKVAEGIMQDANPFYAENLLVLMDRKGFIEETYWTFSYSPAFNDAGQVEGIFCACFEVTNTLLSQRRLKTLKDISDATAQVHQLEEACQSMCEIIDANQSDIPFSMIYLLNATGSEARLVGMAGDVRPEVAPVLINMNDLEGQDNCPLAKVFQTKKMILIDQQMRNNALQEGLTNTNQVAIHPVFRPGLDQVIGFFISGISPRLEYNSDYQNFHRLLIGHIATSITSLQAREELIHQQQFLQDVFQQAPVGITIMRGPQYIIDLANPEVCEIWGRKPEEVLGKPVIEAIPEAGEQGFISLLDQVVNTGQPFIANELPVVLERNGEMEQTYLDFLYHPMRDSQGFVSGVIAVAINISEQVKSRREIETINRQLLTINADLDNFVYSASHDLKAPISNIEGLMVALEEYLPAETLSSEMVQRLISMIKTSIDRFKRAVSDLTEVAKLQRDTGEDITVVDLPEVVAEVCLDFEPIIEAMGARIETDFSDGIIRFSAKNIRSIIYNLLSNALKYSSPDRPPHIRFRTERTPEYTILTVSDNGLGMDMADKDKIFSMFKRLHDHVEGSGVGLYIVKKIVENAGGSIEVESKLGEGTTFKINFKH
ncbi:ATP-binding protein [Pontibacter ruber]|uniref:histidine kinase n=1 Tax=Pontibacter ruber TaxID=1343895 RepID=A0ABW5CXI4_9BACT|nr:ATP-binding protein [Pontibacter ruber]